MNCAACFGTIALPSLIDITFYNVPTQNQIAQPCRRFGIVFVVIRCHCAKGQLPHATHSSL